MEFCFIKKESRGEEQLGEFPGRRFMLSKHLQTYVKPKSKAQILWESSLARLGNHDYSAYPVAVPKKAEAAFLCVCTLLL